MSDGGDCGQQLVMRQQIYFLDHSGHSPDTQAFTRIFRQACFALLCGIRPHAAY